MPWRLKLRERMSTWCPGVGCTGGKPQQAASHSRRAVSRHCCGTIDPQIDDIAITSMSVECIGSPAAGDPESSRHNSREFVQSAIVSVAWLPFECIVSTLLHWMKFSCECDAA